MRLTLTSPLTTPLPPPHPLSFSSPALSSQPASALFSPGEYPGIPNQLSFFFLFTAAGILLKLSISSCQHPCSNPAKILLPSWRPPSPFQDPVCLISLCPSLPPSRHPGLLLFPPTFQVHSHLRAFAHCSLHLKCHSLSPPSIRQVSSLQPICQWPFLISNLKTALHTIPCL